MNVVLGVGTEDNQFRRLFEFATLHVDIRHARGALACGIEIDPGDIAIGPIGEVVLREQHGEDRGLGRRLRVVAAGEPFAVAAVGALTHLHTVRVLVGLRRIRGGARKRLETNFLGRLVEEHGRIASLERRQRITSRARPLERVAAGLDPALNVAGLARSSAEILELVVMRFEVLVADTPVLDRHIRRNEVLAVTRFGVTANLEVGGEEAPMLTVPMDTRTPYACSRTERTEVAHRQCCLVERISESKRLARRLLEQSIADRVFQFVLDMRGCEIRDRIAKLAALDSQHLETRVGEFLCQNRRRPSKTDQHDINGFESRGHGSSSPHCGSVAAHEPYRGERVRLAVLFDFVDVVVARAWEAD
jgi:hypothetical protein